MNVLTVTLASHVFSDRHLPPLARVLDYSALNICVS